ncbi:hypothetical protein [Chthonobacter rhizosphaerae]|uniref:hypothetical protein n=1 Tax=Chthonobacter rhizosphaerae TaxID=2735553 RepID=UPI0015EE9963|nr:hypothetical protein [Chthonobacter rhizosphaerae]
MSFAFLRQAAIASFIVAVGTGLAGMVPPTHAVTATAEAAATPPPLTEAPRGDLPEAASVCRTSQWPYRPAECLHRADGRRVAPVRWVTVETRVGEEASALVAVVAE